MKFAYEARENYDHKFKRKYDNDSVHRNLNKDIEVIRNNRMEIVKLKSRITESMAMPP